MGRNRLYEAEVLVVVLGRFGSAAARELQRLRHRVTAIERDISIAERYLDTLSKVVHANASDVAVVDKLRAKEYRLAVVGIGTSIEQSVLASANLVDAGISSIWSKAVSAEHARILTRIGVQHVVRPEADSGHRVAHLVNGKLMDYMEFDDGFAIVKLRPPQESIGFTLEQSKLRSKYGVTIVGVKASGQDFTYAVPDTRINSGDTLIVSGPFELIERLANRP